MSSYRGGHILRIKVINFMTYEELEIFPKSGLNLILGLNGSGKSSLMCAICLGLAGKPQLTGRSSKLSDFVKFGCEEAKIEIELEDISKKNITISRTIHKEKSTWLLNKKVVTQIEVENLVKKFNIDMSNLCQFLPQEKVMEFSKMDKKQRLENMLKTVGDQELSNTFKELKEIGEKSFKLEEEINKYRIQKETDEEEIQRLKAVSDNYEEKLRMKENLKSLHQHKTYLMYYEIKRKVEALGLEKKALKAHGKCLSDRLEVINEKNASKTKDFHEVVEQMEILNEKIASLQEDMIKKRTEMDKFREKVSSARIHYQNKIQEKRMQILQLTEIATKVQDLKNMQKEGESQVPLLKKKDEEISQNVDSIKNQLSSLASIRFLKLTEKQTLENIIKENVVDIKKLENENSKKMELLKQQFIDVYQAVIWLEENRNLFRAPVHQPMFLTVKINQRENCRYFENLVDLRDMLAFICEDKEDSKLLTKIFRIQKNWNVSIVMVPDNPIEYYKSLNLTSELKQLGVVCLLKDFIEAPNAIKRFLCHFYKLHLIPICLKIAEQNINKIFLHDSNIPTFFTLDAKFSGRRSKYGDMNLFIKRDQLKSGNFLPLSKDSSEELYLLKSQLQIDEEKIESINEKLENIEKETKQLEIEELSLKAEKKTIYKKLQTYSNVEEQLKQKLYLHEKKSLELIDEDEEKSKLANLIQRVNVEMKTTCLSMLQILQEYIKWQENKICCNLKARVIQKVLTSVRKSQSELEKEKQEVEEKYLDCSSKSKEIKKEGFVLKEVILVWKSSYEEARNKGLFNFFNIDNRAEIEREICRAQIFIDLNSDDNTVAVADYKEKRQKLAELIKKIENIEQNLKDLQEEIKRKKSLCLPQLQNHIQKINAKFSEYYKQLNYSGEIILDTCNDTDDILNYGLQITLKYRDSEPLLELSNTHHSGGECSVAAIIFILSLQGFTHIPFRCIDEINQGMDSQNERNMYDLIAQSAKSESSLQYFLLSPKLLMNLEMIEQMDAAVHVIYNSCFMGMKVNVAKDTKFVEKKKKKY